MRAKSKSVARATAVCKASGPVSAPTRLSEASTQASERPNIARRSSMRLSSREISGTPLSVAAIEGASGITFAGVAAFCAAVSAVLTTTGDDADVRGFANALVCRRDNMLAPMIRQKVR